MSLIYNYARHITVISKLLAKIVSQKDNALCIALVEDTLQHSLKDINIIGY